MSRESAALRSLLILPTAGPGYAPQGCPQSSTAIQVATSMELLTSSATAAPREIDSWSCVTVLRVPARVH